MASDAVIGTNSGGELEDDIASGFEDPASGDEVGKNYCLFARKC